MTTTKTKDCPTCAMPLKMVEDDVAFNNERLSEQKDMVELKFRTLFMYRYTCALCGKVFLSQRIKRK